MRNTCASAFRIVTLPHGLSMEVIVFNFQSWLVGRFDCLKQSLRGRRESQGRGPFHLARNVPPTSTIRPVVNVAAAVISFEQD